MHRKRRGRKSQIEGAIDQSISKLIEFQQKQRDESSGTLLQLEKERFLWEKEQERQRDNREEEREVREMEFRREQLALEERRMRENGQLLLQLAGIFAKSQSGSTPASHSNQGRSQPYSIHDVIPPYIGHNSFEGSDSNPCFWQDSRK